MTETMISKSNILKKLIFVLVLAVLPLAMPGAWAAGVPQLINYQGTLTNAAGSPVPDGSYQVRFAIYNVATGGTPLWQETWSATTTPITTSKGNFSVMLGSLVAIPATFFSVYPVTYLGVTVGADAEMTPRQRIASVAYAFHAGDGVPKGGIIMWSGAVTQIPTGWALCNGLNGTPDLRDKFIVGAGGAYTTGSTGGTASISIAAHAHPVTAESPNTNSAGSHQHSFGGNTGSSQHENHSVDDSDDSNKREVAGDEHYHSISGTTGAAGDHFHTVNSHAHGGSTGSAGSTSADNRPPYYALAFIMKL